MEHTSMTAKNAALRAQLTPENQDFWDQLVTVLQQDPRLQDQDTLQAYLNVQLPQLLAAQAQGKTAAEFYHDDPIAAAQKLMRRQRTRPWWLTADLWFPVGLFFVALILPTVILPAVPLQLLLIGVQFLLLVVALAVGIWLTPRFSPRGRTIAWGVVVVLLIGALNLVARTLPAMGLIYVTRRGGSIALVLLAIVITAAIVWDQRRHPESWLPALVADLWIMTVLALLARIAPTASLMATATGNWLIALGTLIGDFSILIGGWHIWRQRRTVQMMHDHETKK